MPSSVDEPILAGTLVLVNLYREALGYSRLCRLRAGWPTYVGSCPLARSMPAVISVGPRSIVFEREKEVLAAALAWDISIKALERDENGEHYKLWMPKVMVDFTLNFDAGLYPELQISRELWGRMANA